jgi:hypothetical protein
MTVPLAEGFIRLFPPFAGFGFIEVFYHSFQAI